MKVYCPACRKEVSWEQNPHRPFCSPECKGRDLGNWATERYRIPAEQAPESDGASERTDAKKAPSEE